MTSIGPINTSVLQLFQQFSRLDAAKQPTDAGDGILKAANGISAESSTGTKAAAAVIGKFAVDSASTDQPLGYKLVIGDLGTFDTWEEAKAFVNGNEKFSDSQKREWVAKLDGYANGLEEFKKIQASDLHQSSMSGAIRDEWLALQEANKGGFALSAEHVNSMDKFLTSLGRETLTDSLSRAPNSILPKSSATQEAANKSGNVSVETIMSMNSLLEREGRTSFVNQMGEKGYEAFLKRIAARAQ